MAAKLDTSDGRKCVVFLLVFEFFICYTFLVVYCLLDKGRLGFMSGLGLIYILWHRQLKIINKHNVCSVSISLNFKVFNLGIASAS